jgi:hypothetical protein
LDVGDVLARIFCGLARQQKVRVPHGVGNQWDGAKARRLHARQAVQLLEEPRIKLLQPVILVPAVLRIQTKKQQILLVETEFDLLQLIKRPDVQPCADQQQQGKGHLQDDQAFAQPRDVAA